MQSCVGLFFIFWIVLVQGSYVDYFAVDSFTVDSRELQIIVPDQYHFPLETTDYDLGLPGQIVGGQRDFELIVDIGLTQTLIKAVVSQNHLRGFPPRGALATLLLQWDGDDTSMTLSPSGLGGLDFTVRGSAIGLRSSISLTESANLTISIYSTNSNDFCVQTTELKPSNDTLHNFIFSSFTLVGNGCDFRKVGAVQLTVDLSSSNEFAMGSLTCYGNHLPTRTPSPTPSPGIPGQYQIDNYFDETPPTSVTCPLNGPIPPPASVVTSGSDILGRERDMELTVTTCNPGQIFTMYDDTTEFYCGNPYQGYSTVVIQYDGEDDSTKLNPLGLGHFNAIALGKSSFSLTMGSYNFPCEVVIRVYSTSSSSFCQHTLSTTGDSISHQYEIAFSSFTSIHGGCSFSDIGAIQLTVSFNNGGQFFISGLYFV